MTPSRKAPKTGTRSFAATWWGRAWIDALEDSTLDAGRLSRGRTYARKGMVHTVVVTPGALKAKVEGSRPWPYDAAVYVPVLTDTQWNTLLDAVAAQSGRTAALLDGEMPQDLAGDAATARVPLLPQPEELEPECTCPDWGYPCKHAAALCYAIASSLDEDPFILFTLRGRDRDSVLTGLRARRRAAAPSGGEPAEVPGPYGVAAREAFASWSGTFTPPSRDVTATAGGDSTPDGEDTSPPAPAGRSTADPAPAPLSAEPPAAALVDLADITALMRDTARRARHLAHGHTAGLSLDATDDAIRIAAAGADEAWFNRLVTGTGMRPSDFARLVRAARLAGPAGVTTARTPLTPDPVLIAAARTALTEASDPETAAAPVSVWRNRLTWQTEGVQLRLGPDGHWHPYIREALTGRTDWWPCAPAQADPVAALTSARSALGAR